MRSAQRKSGDKSRAVQKGGRLCNGWAYCFTGYGRIKIDNDSDSDVDIVIGIESITLAWKRATDSYNSKWGGIVLVAC